MSRVRTGCLGLVASLAFLVATQPALAQNSKPNVVFILADNVGYGDLGPYGGGELRGAPTPRIDELAREGLRLTQYLVEPGCTPSRAALMTGQYSIRNGLSLIIVPGSLSTLSKSAVTMGELFKSAGYATAIFGKRHLGAEPQSLPTAHGFDEFYGIPPDISWDSATYVDTITLTHSKARLWPGIRNSTTSRWTRTRTYKSALCLGGRSDRCSRRSKSIWSRSRNILTHRHLTSRASLRIHGQAAKGMPTLEVCQLHFISPQRCGRARSCICV